MDNYDPGCPWVRRIQVDGLIAMIIMSYFDDGQVTGPNCCLAELGLQQVVSGIQYLSNQDAARKRRSVSKRPATWAGSVTYTDQQMARKLLTQIKWDKAKSAIAWVIRHVQEDIPMERTKFRSKTGFLGHATNTYNLGAPYLQGFYLSENSWCNDHNPEGYRLPEA